MNGNTTASSHLSSRLRLLAGDLGKAPTPIFLIAYLMLIVVFSLLYYFLLPGRNFYHSTAQYEYDYLNADADRILQSLQTQIVDLFMSEYNSPQAILHGWRVDIQEIGVYSLNVDTFPEDIQFTLNLPITYAEDGQVKYWSVIHSMVRVPLSPKLILEDTVFLFPEFPNSSALRIEGVPSLPGPEMLFTYGGGPFSDNHAPALPLPLDLYETIVEFGQGYKGFPSGISGQYLRMLYLSAGIATTSALGDIVPVSNQARLGVTIESVLAIVIIALMMNSIVHDVASSLGSHSDD